MSRLLNAYAYMYATYLSIYLYFLYDLFNVSPLKVLILSSCLLLETHYVLKEDSKNKNIYFIVSVLICTLLSYQNTLLSLTLGIYYLVIQAAVYFILREGKEIEVKHLWIPLMIGFAVSMYLYEFQIHGFEAYMLSYFIIALCALASSNLDIYYIHRHDSREKQWLDYSLLSVVIGVSLFIHWILIFLQNMVSFLISLSVNLCIALFSLLIDIFAYGIGLIMSKIFRQGSLPDIKIEISENILGPLKPAETQNADFLKILVQVLVLVAIIGLLRYVYKRYKEGKYTKENKKELKAYYQEVEDLKREQVPFTRYFTRENLSKIRRMYKKEVKKRIRQGHTFLNHYTPKEYLKTLPDSSLNDLTSLYQKERYGGSHEKRH